MDLAGRIVRRTERATPTGEDPQSVLQGMCADAVSLVQRVGASEERLLGIGIAMEGIVDPSQGRLMLLANFGWGNVPVRELVKSTLGVPTVVCNSGMAMVLGEYLYGAGRDAPAPSAWTSIRASGPLRSSTAASFAARTTWR